MNLAVIVPAYNEAATIETILKKLVGISQVYEVVVVDDASKDDTVNIVNKISSKKITLVSHDKNKGKGAAIQTALEHVKGDYILIQDADLEYDPEEIPSLIAPIEKGRADVVFGSRFFGAHTNMFYWHFVGNKLLNLLVNVLYNTIMSDMETCYKVMPTELIKSLKLKENDFRIEPEISCKLLRRGIVILEVPITYIGRSYDDGKKITWIDWFLAVQTILRIRIWGE